MAVVYLLIGMVFWRVALKAANLTHGSRMR
jgi:hypothetical protein